MRSQIRGNGHVNRHSIQIGSMGDESDSAGSPGAQRQTPNGHRNGIYRADLHWFARLLFRRDGVHQYRAVVGYPDASHFVGVPSIAPGVGHGHDGLGGCPGIACPQHAGRSFWPGENMPRCNSAVPGRSGCRGRQRCGNGRTERAWVAAERFAWAYQPMREHTLWTVSSAS